MSSPDPQAVLAAFGLDGPSLAAPVAGGWDTAIWRVERAEAVYALRLFRPDQVETCRREVLAMRAAAEAGIPVPAVHAEATWQDRPALLLSWCPGRPLVDALAASPRRALALGLAFGRMQARIHAVRAPEGLPGWEQTLGRRLGPDHEPLLERLRAAHPRQDALLHLDYHPLNLLVDRRRLTVLDWANASAGDPRLDAARTVAILRLAPHEFSPPLRHALELGWRRGYQQLAGPLGDLALFHALAGAIMERDLAAKLGRPGISLEPAHLEPIRRWALAWERRAGIRR